MAGIAEALAERGCAHVACDAATLAWAKAAHAMGCEVVRDPQMRAQWLQCEVTWFVGVDALPSAQDGSVAGVPLAGPVIDALRPLPPLHPAQLSVTYPGYPRPRAGESAAAFRYRQTRHAAHVDGITPEGPARRRFVTEPNAFVLGLPLTRTGAGASPLMVWEGSHHIIGDALRAVFASGQTTGPPGPDLTETYQAARRECFARCSLRALHALPGEALLLHRHTLHGIGPWQDGATAPPEGRMVAYFRPLHPQGLAGWLAAS